MARANLVLGPKMTQPIEAVTETLAVLGRRGSGKTYGAGVIVEEMLAAKQQVVIIDPLDVWWGLRSSADGKRPGLPVTVLGGEHGDLPLEEGDAGALADLVTSQGSSVVLSVEHWSKAAQRRFVAAFCRRLYRRNRDPLHLVIDEADIFAPQNPRRGDGDAAGCFSAVDAVVRRGRAKGLGVTLISQRPAVLHKDVLTQASVLFALQLTSPQDRHAIRAWIEHQGDPEQEREVLASLSKLKTGEVWAWAPQLTGLVRAKFRRKRTFDSSVTPKIGQRRVEPKRVAKVDLDGFRQQLADSVERAKQNDPAELQRQVRQLTKDLEAAKRAKPTERTQMVEVSVLSPKQLTRVEAALSRAEGVLERCSALHDMTQALARVVGEMHSELNTARSLGAAKPPAPALPQPTMRPQPPPTRGAEPPVGDRVPVQQRLLDALGWLQSIGITNPPRIQVSLMASVSPKSSALGNHLGALRSAGLVNYVAGKRLALTESGITEAHIPAVSPTPEDLHARLREKLPPVQWRLLETLIAQHPESLSRAEVAESADVSPTSSALGNHLGALRSLGLIQYMPGKRVAATPLVFLQTSGAA